MSCLGRCDIAPAGAVDERPIRLAEADRHVDDARGGRTRMSSAKRGDERRPNDPYAAPDGALRRLRGCCRASSTGAAIIQALKDSGLRGMGGAGFPTGTKWELVARRRRRAQVRVCNADESEPGTFKDRADPAEHAAPACSRA